MKVLFVACTDSPFDHNAGSGKDFELYHGLIRNGAEVIVAGPFPFSQTLAERVFRRIHRMLFKRRPPKYTDSFLIKAAKEVEDSIRKHQPDVIFSKYLGILCRVHTGVPMVVLSDTTLAGSQREWPIFTHAAFIKQNRGEQKAYDMAHSIFVHSDWSVEDLVQNYRQPREKIYMNPCPASIPAEVVPDAIEEKSLSPLKILIVGREYDRKGVDIAVETVRQLNREGTAAVLRIVGLKGEGDDQVQYMGLYNKTIPEQLQRYADNYRWANFLLHPARFEAAGIVPAEAAAFGVPTLTNNVGGLASTVADGVSGVVLPKHSPAEGYVRVLQDFTRDPAAYRRLCLSTRQRYETELNWNVVSKKLYRICLAASGSQS